MTVSTTLNKITYSGNGAQTAFPFTFAFPGGTPTQEAANIQVIFTDVNGNQTTLTQGPGTTQYQIVFNSAAANNPTPVGGTVTYNPNSVPIPTGTTLTIYRNMPVTQPTSLTNQGTQYQQATEGALDYLAMLSQQVLEVQTRALVTPVTDPAIGPLPSQVARKNLILGFDSSGNPVAVNAAPQGTISAPMIPVVGAATLAAARTAMGLGSIATESIGLGLADNGAGAVQIQAQPAGDTVPTSVTLAMHTQERILFNNVTYTLPQSSTLFSGFLLPIQTRNFTATITPFATDQIDGAALGQSITIPPGTNATIMTNANGAWFVVQQPVWLGNNAPSNLQLNASVAGSALTIAVKNHDGNDPTTSSPVVFTTGSPSGQNTQRAIAAPLSITVPNGATLGTVNGQASRIWVGLFDNAGTPVLGVFNALSATAPVGVLCWDETSSQTTTNISAGSTNDQTWYTAGALTGKNFRIIGMVESTQPTAGAWTASPTAKLFGPGQKKPGDVVQEFTSSPGGSPTTTSGTFVVLTSQTVSITPQSAANLIRLDVISNIGIGQTATGQSVNGNVSLSRGTTNNSGLIGTAQLNSLNEAGAGATIGTNVSIPLLAFDLPNTTSAQNYALQGNVNIGTLSAQKTIFTLKEIYA